MKQSSDLRESHEQENKISELTLNVQKLERDLAYKDEEISKHKNITRDVLE